MKSYYLEELDDAVSAGTILAETLPGQSEPWILFDAAGKDAVAYFNIGEGDQVDLTKKPFVISADISGRHHHADELVLDVLRRLRQKLGGTIRNDDDQVVE